MQTRLLKIAMDIADVYSCNREEADAIIGKDIANNYIDNLFAKDSISSDEREQLFEALNLLYLEDVDEELSL